MSKTKIEWVKNPDGSQGHSWNPIQGLCPVGCWYCYARRIYQRFHLNPMLNHIWIKPPVKPCGVFVCSTMELFHPDIPKEWRDLVFKDIEERPNHRFYILTKLPQNIDRPMPDNVWLGVSITGNDKQWYKGFDLYLTQAKTKFISFEPLLKPIEIIDELFNFDWIIVGRLTGHGKKYQPERAWIQEIVDECKAHNIPVFLKDNLKEIWGNPLIQEMPKHE
ncbi:MAG: DUF5131 family protein [Candidatus Aenigmatarchaeota archaeon]|nr:MAG: DUF5131 family protein [Candidatus Aenigmarchaeota archaeon]